MAPTVNSPEDSARELREHQETFHSFSKLVLFAVLHIVLVLVCLALGFLGHIPVLAVLMGLGGTLALLVAFVIAS
jgi:hypothetical protein